MIAANLRVDIERSAPAPRPAVLIDVGVMDPHVHLDAGRAKEGERAAGRVAVVARDPRVEFIEADACNREPLQLLQPSQLLQPLQPLQP